MAVYALNGEEPRIDDSCWIAPGANAIGRVSLASHASLWFGATLRGDNEWIMIGERSNVQENCVLHTDIGFPLVVGRNCTLGHSAIIHGCTIDDEVLIGMGSVVMNGVHIGAQSLVGAGALVTEGKKFPPRSLIVGSPARVLRSLSDKEVADLMSAADHYDHKAQLFRQTLKQTS